MRNRSNSGVRLDFYQRLVKKTILRHQNPASGLFPASEDNSHAWVRDNLYSIMAVWGLSLAYRKNADLDEDRSKAYELEQRVVKLMRGILHCIMMQKQKLEKFKKTQHPDDCFHAKFCSQTGKTVVGDREYGHLQLDATSLFVLLLAQMTASGLQIIYTLNEVSFVQNLVFYIETAYRTPDYGIWERGDKTNHGLPELNSSSIGMAKAALEAINEQDLFGSRGGPTSVIHVLPDEAQQCQAILQSMLPRESSSKEVDASLLGIISYPAFAVDDPDLVDQTRKTIQEKLQGNYGCCRFLRDGYKTVLEDPSRLYYHPGELQKFENIECEWPLFFAYFALDGIFNGNKKQTDEYLSRLDELMVKTEDGKPLMPELYRVPANKVDAEKKNPGTQKREFIGKLPHKWGQSLYILAKLLHEGFLSPGELDPLNRRLVMDPRPDVVVQVVILAENAAIQDKLNLHGIDIQLVSEVYPIQVYPARALSKIYSLLGKNKGLGLTGRPSNEVGLLATSKLYLLEDQLFAFIPQFMDQHYFYVVIDTPFLIDLFRTEVAYLKASWQELGRPTLIIPLDSNNSLHPALIATIKKLQTGYISGTRVQLGNLADFRTTSCVTHLDFVKDPANPSQGVVTDEIISLIGNSLSPTCPRPKLLAQGRRMRRRQFSQKASISGIIKRTRSIQINPEEALEIRAQLNRRYESRTTSGDSSPTSPTSPTSTGSPANDSYLPHLLKEGTSVCPRQSEALHSPHHHMQDMTQFEHADCQELVGALGQVETLTEQADILHYLYIAKGLEWDTEIGGKKGCLLKELLVELYEKAGHWKQWWLVRHTAGMLKKRVEDLALAAADLLVRQKQLSVGLPPEPREKIITSPLPPDELASIIYEACGEDVSTASLTQEILIYLAMFIRTEPKLFNEMIRLRVGLIIQVMASELARTLKCEGDEASEHLLNLSPFEMKTLLHHILSGKEFLIHNVFTHERISESEVDDEYRLSVKTCEKNESQMLSKITRSYNKLYPMDTTIEEEENEDEAAADRQGQWIRRRRLDGSLNRTPVGFYEGVWKVLERCPIIYMEGYVLNQALTKEMTPGELKFALQVEMVLNRIPQPEYRQLMVEGLMILTLLVENDNGALNLNRTIHIEQLVQDANNLFIEDQQMPSDVVTSTTGPAGICQHFYDSAPSGRYGTMSYLCRALTRILQLPTDGEASMECAIS